MVMPGAGQDGRQLPYQHRHHCGTAENQIIVIVHHVVVYVCTAAYTIDYMTVLVTRHSYCHCVREMQSRWQEQTIKLSMGFPNIIVEILVP